MNHHDSQWDAANRFWIASVMLSQVFNSRACGFQMSSGTLPVVIDTESYRDLQESYGAYNFVTEALFGSCPDLIIKERTAAVLAWHGGH
jgi:hypothetical protein